MLHLNVLEIPIPNSMVDIVFAILYVYNDACMECPAGIHFMLDYHVTHLRVFGLPESPPLRFLLKVFTIRTCMALIVEGCYRIDACLGTSRRKSHADTPKQGRIACV